MAVPIVLLSYLWSVQVTASGWGLLLVLMAVAFSHFGDDLSRQGIILLTSLVALDVMFSGWVVTQAHEARALYTSVDPFIVGVLALGLLLPTAYRSASTVLLVRPATALALASAAILVAPVESSFRLPRRICGSFLIEAAAAVAVGGVGNAADVWAAFSTPPI
ncbi:MAG: hypothetical protein ACYC7A_20915, partial [Thermoanaerobaculia bacterium]